MNGKKTLTVIVLLVSAIVLALFVYDKSTVDIDNKNTGEQVIGGENLGIDKEHEEEVDKGIEGEVNGNEPGDDIEDVDEATNVGNNKTEGGNKQSTSQDSSDKPAINGELEKLKKKIEDAAVEIKEDTGEPAGKMYEKIFSNYNAKLQSSSTKLINELTNEDKNNTSGLEGLSNITNKKLASLLDTHIEGIGAMSKVLDEKGIHGQHSEYQNWSQKLSDVHDKEAEKILTTFEELARKYK